MAIEIYIYIYIVQSPRILRFPCFLLLRLSKSQLLLSILFLFRVLLLLWFFFVIEYLLISLPCIVNNYVIIWFYYATEFIFGFSYDFYLYVIFHTYLFSFCSYLAQPLYIPCCDCQSIRYIKLFVPNQLWSSTLRSVLRSMKITSSCNFLSNGYQPLTKQANDGTTITRILDLPNFLQGLSLLAENFQFKALASCSICYITCIHFTPCRSR